MAMRPAAHSLTMSWVSRHVRVVSSVDVALEVEVCRCVRGRLDALAEERSDAGGALVEDRLVDWSVGESDQGHADSFVAAASPVIGVCGRRVMPG